MAPRNGQAPKKTMFRRIFRFGSSKSKKKSSSLNPHPTTSSHQAQGVSYERNGCACCEKNFTLRQSFRKSKCHGCQRRVCKKCYLVNKLCHKCKIKQLPEVNSTAGLERIDSDRLVSILNQIHCDSKLVEMYKSDRDALIRTLLTICELRTNLIEYEKGFSGNDVTLRHEKTTLKESKISTKQSDNLPTNSVQLHSPASSMQNEVEAALKAFTNKQETSSAKEELTTEVFQVSNGHYHHHHQTVEQSSTGKDILFVQSPKMNNDPHFNFLPDNVIEEEDEKEEPELSQPPEGSEFPLPPLTPISNRKSELFYSAEDILPIEVKNEKTFHVEVVRGSASGYVKIMPEVHNSSTEKREEHFEFNIKHEVKNEILTEEAIRLDLVQMVDGGDKFETKLINMNQKYRPQYKIDLSSVVREEEIRQMTLFELKTILQKRGRPITGLISYEDFVQKVISVWQDEHNAKEAERKLREEEEEKIRLEKVSLLEEEMRKMEEERERLEEAQRFKSLYEEEYGNPHPNEESEDEESLAEDTKSLSAVEEEKLSDHDETAEFERAEVIQVDVKTASFLKTEIIDLEQLEFEMMENRLEIEEIEEEKKHSFIEYLKRASASQPEVVELDEEDSLNSLPPPPSPPPRNT